MNRGAHLRHAAAAEGPFGLVITPETAGWELSGLRIRASWVEQTLDSRLSLASVGEVA